MDILTSTGLFSGDGPSTFTLAIIGIVCLATYQWAQRRLPSLSITR